MSRRGLLGFAAAACAACCAGPFLAAIGGIAVLGVAGTFVFGLVALAVASMVIVSIIALRRRSRAATHPGDVPVTLTPTRRS